MSEVNLFDKWDTTSIEIPDDGLKRYLSLKPVFMPHSGGRHEHKRFRKSRISIVERLINRMMSPGMVKRGKGVRRPGRISGKKHKTTNIVKQAFEIIHLKTGKNPVQILVDAIVHSAPREEDVRVTYGGISYRKAADTAPQRRVDLALRYLVEAIWRKSFHNKSTVIECLADELIGAAANSTSSKAIQRKQERERIAQSAR